MTTEIVNLPHFILTLITKFLSHNDLMSFRITCVSFYEATLCKDVACRLHVKPGYMQYISKELKEFVQKFPSGKYLKISLELLNASSLQNIIQSMENITDIAINIEHLDIVTEKCRHIKKLVLNDYSIDLFSIPEKCENSEDKFKSLSLLLELNEIMLKGCSQVFSPFVMVFLIKYAPTISKICLENVTINNSIKPTLLSESIFNAKHIAHWKFKDVNFKCKSNILIPAEALSFECINTDLTAVNEKHTNIRKLIYGGIIPYLPRFWINSLINLKHLELRKSFFVSSQFQECRKLKFLKIVDCHQSPAHLLNLSENVKTSLKYLTIQAYNGYYNFDVLQILDLFCNLEELELINMYDISIGFVIEIKNLHLRKITLTNCRKCIGAYVKSEAAMIRSKVSFEIDIRNE